jgi:cytochrome c peroxidase
MLAFFSIINKDKEMIALLSLLIACNNDQPVKEIVNPQITDAVTVDRTKLGAFQPLPENFFVAGNEQSAERIALGRRLFFETQLSADANMSCSTCHNVAKDGADEHKFSPGHKMHPVGRNSPTVFNAAGQVAQFWDGRASTVEEQALGPILAAGEMAMPDAETVVRVLRADPTYIAEFTKAFPGETDPLTFQNVGVAIGAYERTLTTPSRWDEFLKGDDAALTSDEKRGLNTFMEVGCTGCHNGALLGGNTYMKLGLVRPWPNQSDSGRVAVTKNESDSMVFKVAGLRNVTETAPYFHDGSAASLGEAINLMGQHQLGKELTPEQVLDIAAFLGSTKGSTKTF